MPEQSNLGKLAVISAVVLIVSLGLCGASIKLYPDEYGSWLGVVTLIGMVVGVVGLFIALVEAIIKAIPRKDKP